MRLPATALALAFALLTAPALMAQTTESQSGASPDYSDDALLDFVMENPDLIAEDDEEGFSIDGGFVYRKGHWLFRYIPILRPFVVSHAPGANAMLMPVVDPLVMTGTHIPYSKSSFRDRWEERRIRRALRRNVEAANRAQND